MEIKYSLFLTTLMNDATKKKCNLDFLNHDVCEA